MSPTPAALRRAFPLVAALLSCAGCKGATIPPPPTPAFTLHYHRSASDYSGWTAQVSAGANEELATGGTPDGFGAVFPLTIKSGATKLTFKLSNGSSDDLAGTINVDLSGSVREAWVFSGSAIVGTGKIPAVPADKNEVAVYYSRADGVYDG